MYTICSAYNYSIGFINLLLYNLVYTKDNKKLEGVLGKHFNNLLSSKKNDPYYCSVKFYTYTGKKDDNGSYDGALGALEKNEIDFYLKTEAPFFDSNKVKLTPVVTLENYLVAHTLIDEKLSKDEEKFQLLNSIDINFISFFFISYLISIILINFLTFYFKKKKIIIFEKFSFLKLITLEYNDEKNSFYFKILFWFSIIYFFLFRTFITNNIKTTKIIVKTSTFITNENSLFNNFRKICWLEGENEYHFTKTAPEGTFLKKMFQKKNAIPPMFAKKDVTKLKEIDIDHFFIFSPSVVISFMLNLMISFTDMKSFLNSKPFFSINNYFFRRNGNSKKLLLLDDYVTKNLEHGIFDKFVSDLRYIKNIKQRRVYFDIDGYVKDKSKFDVLKLNDFYYIFLAHFFFLLFLFMSLFINFGTKFILNKFTNENYR